MPTALPLASDFTGAGQDEGDLKAAFTALRACLAGVLGTDGLGATALATMGAAFNSLSAKTGAYTIVAADKGKVFDLSGTWSLTASGVAALGDGFSVSYYNSGTGVITFDPNLSETVDGEASVAINAGESGVLYCTGAKWLRIGKSSGIPSGAVIEWAGSSLPAGWDWCDGGPSSRTVAASLFAAIGTTYGVGDGSTTFNRPDRRGRVGVGRDDMGGTAANRITTAGCGINGATLGASGGAQTHTLSAGEMPGHSHGAGSLSSTFYNPGETAPGPSGLTNVITLSSTTTVAVSGSTGSAGSGAAHNNVQPTLICNYIIKL